MSTILSYKDRSKPLSIKEMHKAVLSVSKNLEPYTIKIRRELHMYPELSWQEENTLSIIKREINSFIYNCSLDFTLTEKKGGLWLDLTIDNDAPRILFRADIDALPIQEENNIEFASKNPGIMHACGHDCHTAMLLTAILGISKGCIKPECNIRFVFQRAEEVCERESGGQLLVRDGVCDNIDAAYCLHVGVNDAPGVFFSKQGMQFCNPMTLEIEVETNGGHVASPSIGTNSIDVITTIATELRGIERLLFPPTEPVVFVPSIITAGTASNIRPNRARVVFALRNFFSDEKKKMFLAHIRMKIESIISSYGNAKLSKFNITKGYPVLINDPRSFQFVNSSLNAIGFATDSDDLSFAGDDFSYYLQKVPGCYWVLGAWQENTLDHHTAKFNPDESVLYQGVAYWLLLSLRIPC